ncbi:MAG: formate/nitrite transporter family protein [Candidatus Nitronauta litoralis]|uniref:Formate/nitrite transporter family protein n=1 Tax=Candidatus Nitronauta litoralis TaxID=2705533 RepID=A0A7T0BZ62_9BACT|nr:MAG: formate/nitrite transporter family protein [Candidatus Nitronauta litoralis]
MFQAEINNLNEIAQNKIKYLDRSPLGYFVLSCLAGIYVGFGILLIFSVGGPIHVAGGGAYLKLIMGASFGIALSLVIFAGSELFTGNNMTMVIGGLNRVVRWSAVLKLFLICYLGNLAGSIFIAGLMVQSGSLTHGAVDLLLKVGESKMTVGGWELFVRGVLCNWLVCLAVWTSSRMQGDAAKLIMIFWCLFAFIASGFEHCVANMTVLGLTLMLPHGEMITFSGFGHNLIWVSFGNMVGGAVFVGMVYWFASRPVDKEKATPLTPLEIVEAPSSQGNQLIKV